MAKNLLDHSSVNIGAAILSTGADASPAVIYKNTVLTHGELRQQATQVARGLLARGRQPGERIVICAENCPFFVVAYLGVIRAGLVAVPVPPDVSAATLEQLVRETESKELLVSESSFKRLRPAAEKCQVVLQDETTLAPAARSDSAPDWPKVDAASSLAALIFTSGSTGVPKGVMVSHRNIAVNSQDIIGYLGLTAADRAMVVLPFHYCYGLSVLHTLLLAGGAVVLNNNFRLFPEAVLQEMIQKKCTGLAGVPSTYQLLLRKSRFCQLRFPQLRWLQQAGGKLPNLQIIEILQAFPQVRFYTMYGQTEATARLSYLPPERLGDKLGSIGCGLPATRLEVLTPAGMPVCPGSDEVGEIVASGDNITRGYWNDPVETARFFRAGKLHTGDLARVDAEGFIYIVNRDRDLIKSGGNRVSATEVEDVVAELPAVVAVAVLGVPHELLGEAVHAVIVAQSGAGLTAEAVRAHCWRRLAPFKVPEQVTFLEQLPQNSAGKVLKPRLKEMLQSAAQT